MTRCCLCRLADAEPNSSSCAACKPDLNAAWRRLLDVLADRALAELAAKAA